MPRRLRQIAWIYGAVVLAGIALRPRFGDELLVTRYTGYVMPWLALGLLPSAIWAWVSRCRLLAGLLGASGAIIVGIHLPLFWRGAPVASPPGFMLKVMSYNTWSKNADARRIAGVILAERPDLLLLQEVREELLDALLHELRDLYGGGALHATYDRTIQQAVVTRYPLEPGASMKWKGQAQVVVVRSPAGAITVLNVHPLRTGGWRHRYRQIAELLEENVLPVRSPVILGGDLNVTEHSQLYRLVTAHLRNAHDAAGRGFGFTYPAAVRVVATLPALPMARIDHVFFSDHFVAVRARTLGHSGGSDHRPVIAEVKLVASTVPALRSGDPCERPQWDSTASGRGRRRESRDGPHPARDEWVRPQTGSWRAFWPS